MTPTETANSQSIEDQKESRERRRTTILPIEAFQHTSKRQCRGNETTEADKTCQPGPRTEKTKEDAEQKQGRRRHHATWEDIGLVEYNPKTTKCGCRIQQCQRAMITQRLTHYRRSQQHPEHNLGKNKKDITRPYCNKTYWAQDRLLMHIELSLRKRNRNAEICINLKAEDAPREKWIKMMRKMGGT